MSQRHAQMTHIAIAPSAFSWSRQWQDIMELTRARLTFMVLLSTAVGYYLGAWGSVYVAQFLNLLLGVGAVASGAMALNQWLERDTDALMERTADRPLPAGRMQSEQVLCCGTALAVSGLLYLLLTTNILASFVAMVTLATYLFLYTPLKKKTALATLIGAFPGALPPLIGWAAARSDLGIGGWLIFAILFIWQLPHFLAIAWLYRDDYASAGLPMLSVVDREGSSVARQILLYTIVLIPVSLLPSLVGMAGRGYFFIAVCLGGGFLSLALLASINLNRYVRMLFRGSLVYLAALFICLMIDKVT